MDRVAPEEEAKLELYQIGPRIDGRRRNPGNINALRKSKPWQKVKEESDVPFGPKEMKGYLLNCFGGWQRFLRLYVRSIKKAPASKQLDGLAEIFKLLVKDDKAISEESLQTMTDADLLKIAQQFVKR